MNIRCSYFDIARDERIRVKEAMFKKFDDEMLIVETFRLNMISLLRQITKMSDKVKKLDAAKSAKSAALVRRFAADLEKAIESCKNRRFEKRLDAMLTDTEGEILLAIAPDHYTRWGRHYLLSMLDAHRLELCNNFKDKSVASYGGSLFARLQSDADDTFCELPPPEPSNSTIDSLDNYHFGMERRATASGT